MHTARKRRSAPSGGVNRGSRRDARRQSRRRGRLIGALTAAGLVAAGLAGCVLVVVLNSGSTQASSHEPAAGPPGSPAATVPARTTPAPSRTPTHPRATRKAAPPPSAKPPTGGTGTFVTAQASGASVGSGTVRRYQVQVEQGSGVSPEAAAAEIQGILADPRGWTADGHDAFQLVSGGPADFEIKIATPDTVDAICGAAGLHTHGEVNCDVGDQVVVNLKRWNQGSPEFDGPLHEYRALIINHEVGHRIGHGHEGCPGPGRPAPAMMQQIDGLHGCRPNAWPYDREGTYLSGPPVP
jgi:hypothetical protein